MATPVPAPYVAAFEKLGFGMFVHWGLYSQLEKGEWILNQAHIAKRDYRKLFDTFTAADFDAPALARLAKQAGMRYIVLTTRHHEGFSLYDTRGLNTYDAPHSPAHRDLVREFVDACRAEDIVPFFYHTTLDWDREDFWNDFPHYQQYLRDSVEILCTQYGKIGGFWFDGNWSRTDVDWEEDALYEMIRRHQPDAIIINNSGIHERGAMGNPQLDSVTFENGRAEPMNREGMPKYVAAEMCLTMNDHWGYTRQDWNYKSVASLICDLCACRKVGANFLLNIGPTAQGGLYPLQKATLETLGEWVATFREAVYDVHPAGIRGEGENFGLMGENNYGYLYLHQLNIQGDTHVTVYEGRPGARTFTGVTRPVNRIVWLDNGQELTFTQDGDTLVVDCPPYTYGQQMVVRVARLEVGE